ncbi:hypothetical protein SLE2022_188350 [Rubroshorea leprosula]
MEISLVFPHKSLKSIGEDVVDAILPISKLLSIAVVGFILTHPKIKLLPKATLKLLGRLVFALLLPCLIFTRLGPNISLKHFVEWWFIPLNVVISTVVGCVLGCLVAFICRPPPEFFRFTVIMTAFGNTGNIPIALVSAVCHTTDNPFGSSCVEGLAYASFSHWVSVILVYTFVYHMMEPPLEHHEIATEAKEEEEEEEGEEEEIMEVEEEQVHVNSSTPLLVEAEWPEMEEKATEHCETPFIAMICNSLAGVSRTDIHDIESTDEENPTSPKSIRCLAEPKMVKKIRIVAKHTPIRYILQPPLIVTVLTMVIGIIPKLNTFVFSPDTAFSVITGSLEIIAEAMVPSLMLVLGGMLTEGPNESGLGILTTAGIIIARLLVLPFIGIGIIQLANKWNLLMSGNELYRFVLLLQYTTPSAILLGAVASLRGYALKEASALLFWQHVFALFSLSIYLVVYFRLLISDV